MHRLFTIHAISWALLIVDLLLMFAFRIFFISGWIDIALLSVPFLSGICITLAYHKRLSRAGKIYFRLYIIYPALCGILLYFKAIVLLLISLPFIFLIDSATGTRYVKNGPYTAKSVPTIMGPMQVGFYKKYYLVEKEGPIILADDSILSVIQNWKQINAVTENDTAVFVNAIVNDSTVNVSLLKDLPYSRRIR